MNEDPSLVRARAATSSAVKAFSKLADVVGIGLTRIGSVYGVKINFSRQPDKSVDIPDEIAGVPVKIEVVGTIRKVTKRPTRSSKE